MAQGVVEVIGVDVVIGEPEVVAAGAEVAGYAVTVGSAAGAEVAGYAVTVGS